MPDINGIPYVESGDLVSGWPTVSQSVAQEVSDQLATKVDYALPVNAQTGTTYTFVAADAEKLTTASNAAAVTLTIPPASSVAWPDNTVLRVVNYGAGAVTIAGGSGVTVTNTASTVAQYGAAVAIRTGSDAWTVVPFGGGDVPSAAVSSPAATGQYSSGGFTYDYYTFTASGTLTVDTAGLADVLIVGGGGGSTDGGGNGGGGGGGGHAYLTDIYLPEGSVTVTVGAGGVGYVNQTGAQGNQSQIDVYRSPGGGGGGGPAPYGPTGLSGGSGGGGKGTNDSVGGRVVISGWGNVGGQGRAAANSSGGGGGGAGGAGALGQNGVGGAGGAGAANSITGSSVTRAGGGGGVSNTYGAAGSGGGGSDSAGTANTGGGASGNDAGGSGVVIVRVKV